MIWIYATRYEWSQIRTVLVDPENQPDECRHVFLFLIHVRHYLLDEVFRVTPERQGAVTGWLSFFHEIIALVLMGIVGALSDRTGRRLLFVVGLLIWATGLVLYPMANSMMQIFAFRFVVAVGVAIASVMIITTMQDYPQEVSRGKWGGFNSFVTSFAILFVSLGLVRLPGVFGDMGHDELLAGRYTFWVGAGIAFFAALIIRLGYFGGKMVAASETHTPFAGFVAGLREARWNPRIALSYGSAFAARGDLVVVGSFFSLWFVRAGAEQGIDSAEAVVRAGIAMIAFLLANVIWAPTYGFILDKINRVSGLCIAMGMAAIGYGVVGMVEDPYDMKIMIPATFILGIGEISAVVSGNALIGQEAPPKIRGASIGVFGLVGTLGILFATFVGGQLFDRIGYGAPFTMMACVNAVIFIWAAIVRTRANRMPGQAGARS